MKMKNVRVLDVGDYHEILYLLRKSKHYL
jgi:hypothetical protein